jgi:hypothetical protein
MPRARYVALAVGAEKLGSVIGRAKPSYELPGGIGEDIYVVIRTAT